MASERPAPCSNPMRTQNFKRIRMFRLYDALDLIVRLFGGLSWLRPTIFRSRFTSMYASSNHLNRWQGSLQKPARPPFHLRPIVTFESPHEGLARKALAVIA